MSYPESIMEAWQDDYAYVAKILNLTRGYVVMRCVIV